MPVDLTWVAAQFPNLTNLAPLAQGGQKTVLSATHPTDGEVVLKLIHPSQDPEFTRRELLAVQQVQAPRVPEIFETGTLTTTAGQLVWVRERRVTGQSVREMLQTGVMAPLEILRLGTQVLESLVQAEVAHIVHRDVKPDNIVRDGNGDFWLLDFGIARHLALTSLTNTTAPFGKFTLGYAPPEQCRNSKPDIDARADLFALGVTLHECATGTNPFWNPPASPLEVLKRVETMKLAPLVLAIGKSDSFRDLVDAMTQTRRDHRPRTAQEAFVWMRDIATTNGI